MSVKTGDIVKILTGKDRGKEGKVQSVNPTKGLILVEGINIIKRHVKPNSRNPKGGIIEKEAAINISNVKAIQSA